MKISLNNSKLGDKIPSLNLPAVITCRKNAPCIKKCYARRGNFARYPNVKQSLVNNLKDYLEDSNKFFNDIIEFLNNGDILYRFFRWFTSGDIVDETFLSGMVRVANECPQTKFLCFTKKFEMINDYLKNNGSFPSNLKVVLSAWDKTFKVDNPYNLPMTYVFFRKQENNADIPEFAIPCQGHCKECKACWSLQNGQFVYFNEHN